MEKQFIRMSAIQLQRSSVKKLYGKIVEEYEKAKELSETKARETSEQQIVSERAQEYETTSFR